MSIEANQNSGQNLEAEFSEIQKRWLSLSKGWENRTPASHMKLAFLKIDLAGYSRIMATASTEGFRTVMINYFLPLLETTAGGGLLWSWNGDGGLIVFDGQGGRETEKCKEALKSALEIRASLESKKVACRMALHYGEIEYLGEGTFGMTHSKNINVVSHLEESTFDDHISMTQEFYQEVQSVEGVAKMFHQVEKKFEDRYKVYTTQKDGKLRFMIDGTRLDCLETIDANLGSIHFKLVGESKERPLDDRFYEKLRELMTRWVGNLNEAPDQDRRSVPERVLWTAVLNGYVTEETEGFYPQELISSVGLFPVVTKSVSDYVCGYLNSKHPERQLELSIVSTMLPQHYYNFPRSIPGCRKRIFLHQEFLESYRGQIEELIRNGVIVQRYTVVQDSRTSSVLKRIGVRKNGYPVFDMHEFEKSKTLQIDGVAKSLTSLVNDARNRSKEDEGSFLLSTGVSLDDYKRIKSLVEETEMNKYQVYAYRKTENIESSIYSRFVANLHTNGKAFLFKLTRDNKSIFTADVPPDFILFSTLEGNVRRPFMMLVADIDSDYKTVKLSIHVGDPQKENRTRLTKCKDVLTMLERDTSNKVDLALSGTKLNNSLLGAVLPDQADNFD